MNRFYVDPYGETGSPSERRARAVHGGATRPTIEAPSYSPSPSPTTNSGTPSVSASPSPRSLRATAMTRRHADSCGSTAAARGSPRMSASAMSPPRRPPSAATPRVESSRSPQANRDDSESTIDSAASASRGAAVAEESPRTSRRHGSSPSVTAHSEARHAPTVPRTRGPGSRMVVPGSKRFDQYHRRKNSLNITTALNAAAADNDGDSALSGATVPSLFATMHSRRRVRTDGAGSSATGLSKGGTRGRPLHPYASSHSGTHMGTRHDDTGLNTEDGTEEGEEVETLELPMQHYVAQSAYTMKNLFRTQGFAAFAANPCYDAPPDVATYTEVTTCSGDGPFSQQRASDGSFLINRLADLAVPANPADRERLYTYLGRTLEVLQTGEWFLKWTRDNSVKQRFVWLNLHRGTIMWSSTAKQSLLDNSELKLSTVTEVKPDCIQDESTGRVFYRMQIRTPDRWKTFATEIREKFDMWFQALVELTQPNLTKGIPGVTVRPSEVSTTNGRGVPGRWTARYSLLSAIAEGASEQLRMDGLPMEARTSTGD